MGTDNEAKGKSVLGGVLGGIGLVGAALLAAAEAPLLAIPAALFGVGALIYGSAKAKDAAREHCPHCGQWFDSVQMTDAAEMMAKIVPSERPTLKRACRDCFKTTNETQLKSYERATARADEVQVFAIRFKGSIPIDSSKPSNAITTDAFRNQDDADLSLRVTASFLGYAVVYERDFARSTGSDGNYRYSLYAASAKLG